MRHKQPQSTAVYIEKRKRRDGTSSYRLIWHDRDGQRRTKNCGPDHQLAKDLKIEKQAELRRGVLGDLPHVALSEFIERLDGLMAGKAVVTVHKTKESLKKLQELCGVSLLQSIDRATIGEFRSLRLAEGVNVVTVNRSLREIKSALSYAVDAGMLAANPMKDWKQLFFKVPDKRIRVVEPEEFVKLLDACRSLEFRALLVTAYRQGLRRTELCNLRWLGPHGEPLVDSEDETISVINRADLDELTKSRKDRTLPIHPDTKTILSVLWNQVAKIVDGGQCLPKFPHVLTWSDGQPFKPDWVSHEFARIVKRSGVEHCTLHDLRRSFSTLAQRAGVDKYTVKDLGGWSSVTVVEKHYTGDVSETYRDAMKKIVQAG